MSSQASVQKLRDLLERLKNGPANVDDAVLLHSQLLNINLSSSVTIRNFYVKEVYSVVSQLLANGEISAASAHLLIAVFKVIAFQKHYSEEDFDAQAWLELQHSKPRKDPIFQFCTLMLFPTDTDNVANFIRSLRKSSIVKTDAAYKELLCELILGHITVLLEILDTVQLIDVVKTLLSDSSDPVHRSKSYLTAAAFSSNPCPLLAAHIITLGDLTITDEKKRSVRYLKHILAEVAPGTVSSLAYIIKVDDQLRWQRLVYLLQFGDAQIVQQIIRVLPISISNDIIQNLDITCYSPAEYSSISQLLILLLKTVPTIISPNFEIASELMKSMSKVDVLPLITEMFKKINIRNSTPFIHYCLLQFAVENPGASDSGDVDLEAAISTVELLNALIRNPSHTKAVNYQHLLANSISNLLETLRLGRKLNGDAKDLLCDELEYRLRTLCHEATDREGFKPFLPFIISNNLQFEKKPPMALLECLASCTDNQLALLSVNMPPKERQLFSVLNKYRTATR